LTVYCCYTSRNYHPRWFHILTIKIKSVANLQVFSQSDECQVSRQVKCRVLVSLP